MFVFFLNVLLLNILLGCLWEEQVKEAVQHPLPRHFNEKGSSQCNTVTLTHQNCFCGIKKTLKLLATVSVCCFLVKKNCGLMPVSTMVLMSVLVHQRDLEGSWGLQQSQRLILPPEILTGVSDHSSSSLGLKPGQLLSSSKFFVSLKARCLHEHFALQQAQLWLPLCDAEAGCSQLCCQMHWWTHAAPGLPFIRCTRACCQYGLTDQVTACFGAFWSQC